jgi:NitT/TauT family transport system substrate-binding protein
MLIVPYCSAVIQASAPGAHKIFTTSEIPGEIPDVLVAQKDLVEQRPADVAQIVLGWDKALRAWKTQPTETEQMMARVLNIPQRNSPPV